jgi:hypothetical protein
MDRKISQSLWMSGQEFRTVRRWSMDCPTVDNGLSDRVARAVCVRCVHVRSPRLGHKETLALYFEFGLIWMEIFKRIILVSGLNGYILWQY